jgi:hypothetical protein
MNVLSRSKVERSNCNVEEGLPKEMRRGRHKPWRVALTSAQVINLKEQALNRT